VLLINTDPASNLDEVLGVALSPQPTGIPGTACGFIRRRQSSALEIALEARNHALVLLLLCNGHDPNLETCSPADLAL
jgi:hypothetical protein